MHEKDEPRWPQVAEKEKEESNWLESVRDYTFLLLCHSLSIRTSMATRIWVSCFPLSRHHGILEAYQSGLAGSPSPQANRTCFSTCYVLCDGVVPFAPGWVDNTFA